VALAVDEQGHRSQEHESGLARPGLVQRRVAGAGRGRAGRQRVHRDVRSLAGQRRGQLLGPVAAALARAALAGAGDDDVAVLVEAQELRERQVESRRDPPGDRERRAGLAALDLRQHRRADARALGQVAQRQVHRLAQRPDPDADLDPGGLLARARRVLVPLGGPHWAYVITYARM
jgi:hypothetical protein